MNPFWDSHLYRPVVTALEHRSGAGVWARADHHVVKLAMTGEDLPVGAVVQHRCGACGRLVLRGMGRWWET